MLADRWTAAKWWYDATNQYEAAERVAMRRWLRSQSIEPLKSSAAYDEATLLVYQVEEAGGDSVKLMEDARAKVDRSLEREQLRVGL